MDKDPANLLARFEKRSVNYPLTIAAVLLAVLLATGLLLSVRDGNMNAAIIFLSSLGLFVILILLAVAMNRRLSATEDRKYIHWDAAMPELQRQNVNIEVHELARVLKVDNEQLTDLLSAYIVAEDLALRQIQQEEDRPLMRHVSIGKTPFDGILVDRDLIVCIEVSFVVSTDIRHDRIEAMVRKLAQARTNLAKMKSRLRLKLMLVIVTQLSTEEFDQLGENLEQRSFKDVDVDAVEIRMLDFEMLQKLYVSE